MTRHHYNSSRFTETNISLYEFEVKNDTLVAHHPRHDDFKLTPVEQDNFEASAWWMCNLEFTRHASRKVNGMKASNGRMMNLVFVGEGHVVEA